MKQLFIVFSLFISQLLYAQQPDLVFHHLTEKDGLSYNIVNCFLKDSRGMLWIGTYNGLNRYDGAHFYVYHKDKTDGSLPDNTVHELVEDKNGNIWGATDNGVFCYNRKLDKFKSYHTPGETEWSNIGNILCDKQGTIWASNREGLVKFNPQSDSFEVAPGKSTSNAFNKIFFIRKNGLAESPDGKGFWMACREGLIYYDKTTQQFISKRNGDDKILFSDTSASGMCATNYGHYWYYDNPNNQLIGFDPVNKKIQYIVKPKEFGELKNIATVFEDNNHLLWICTWNYQVVTVDYLNGNVVKEIKHDKNNRGSIGGDFFWTAMQETDGTLWLGTVGGISMCNTNQSFYKVHHFKDEFFSPLNSAVDFLTECPYDSTWWIATSGNLLLHYEPATAKTVAYRFQTIAANKKGLHPEQVNKMLFFKEGTIMFTNNGAWIKKGNQDFTPFTLPHIGDSVLLKDAAILNDSIVYCTDNKTVWYWNTAGGHVQKLEYTKSFMPDGREPAAYFPVVAQKKLWVVNGNNWISYTDKNKLVPVQFPAQYEEGNGYFTSMTADKDGSLWLTKKGDGLFSYNPSQNIFRQYKQYDGLVMDHVMAVAADHSGKIWTASYNQVSVYNPLLNSFYNFKLPLSENNYAYVNLMGTLANGNVICNMADEIVEFYPGRLRAYFVNTLPSISTVVIAGNEKFLNGDAMISLAPDENSILIKFGLLADYAASPYDMLYILEGAEKKWTIAGNNFEATYNSMRPGKYAFKVKALAKDKSWQTKEVTLKIHVRTPFYASWWFITLFACVFAAGIYAFYRFRLQQHRAFLELENKAQLLEKEKATVMYESLKQQLNPHFLFNSLTSLSGLIEMDQKLASSFLEQMSKLYRYILKSSESETVPLKDEINFVKLFISLQKTRFKNGLEVNINVDDEYMYYKIAPVTLQNMIENAIKHNVIDAASPLVIDIFVEDEYLVIKNNLQRKNNVETSNKQGLANLKSLYRYLTNRPIVIEDDEQHFAIKIPLI